MGESILVLGFIATASLVIRANSIVFKEALMVSHTVTNRSSTER
jgi:hypothetical protein